ncbi:hypothetical protein F7734_14605 [Scytonema sp. UIC 10036]|uniref:hypothetical protein n=1 Tax=Scytonema sp. UIC 10036 TaxID=2304196 RepID=UPI0012DA4A97|nr:hypothetical protein [Scytonema sp. UIC 10036]MUG93587.1 hypothetical protein [Scytonema sp. UIC 10036]
MLTGISHLADPAAVGDHPKNYRLTKGGDMSNKEANKNFCEELASNFINNSCELLGGSLGTATGYGLKKVDYLILVLILK